MKHLTTLFLSLCLLTSGYSQITITSADMPRMGDTVRYSQSNQRFNYDTTGAGIEWHYEGLAAASQGMYDFKSAFLINPVYILFGVTSFGTKIADSFGGGGLPISITNVYNFFKGSSSKFVVDGYGAQISVAPAPIPAIYSDEDEWYQFPLTYGRMDTSTFNVNVNIPALGGLQMQGTRYNEVDGWGKIYLPSDSFDIIRLKSTVIEMDSIRISIGPMPISFGVPRNTVTYKWMANGKKMPVLEVQGTTVGATFTPTQIRYRDIYRDVLRANLSANPTVCTTADTVQLTDRSPAAGFGVTYTYNWSISPATYAFVSGTNAASKNPKAQFNAPGLYTVSLRINTSANTDDTTAIDYILVGEAPTGIEDINSQVSFSIFPNPAQQLLHVLLKDAANANTQINISDMLGRTVMERSIQNGTAESQIDVSSIQNGVYVIRVIDGNKTLFRRVFEKN